MERALEALAAAGQLSLARLPKERVELAAGGCRSAAGHGGRFAGRDAVGSFRNAVVSGILYLDTSAVLRNAAREIDSLWARCAIWELTPAVCDLASQVAPLTALRTLDALHLATYVLARQRIGPEVEMLTVDSPCRTS